MNEPRELVFFTDRDLGHQFPERLLRKENQPFIAKIRRDRVHMSVRKKEWQKRAHVNRS